MATSKMIEAAARGPAKPGVSAAVHRAADAALYRPRSPGDAEEAERLTTIRQVIRMALGRHDCARLPACPEHGQGRCACNPCRHPQHGDDAALAAASLRALGLVDESRITHLTCGTCHRSKALSQFAARHQTCKGCLTEKKAAREAGQL
jgi:hypothetical protein